MWNISGSNFSISGYAPSQSLYLLRLVAYDEEVLGLHRVEGWAEPQDKGI